MIISLRYYNPDSFLRIVEAAIIDDIVGMDSYSRDISDQLFEMLEMDHVRKGVQRIVSDNG